MTIGSVEIQTKLMIEELKTICINFGLGGSPGEYKIITQVYLLFAEKKYSGYFPAGSRYYV